MKVLLLSASTGNGHMSAARAIEAEFAVRGHDAKTVDVLDHTGKGFRGWYRGGYEVLVRRSPKMWGHLYKSSDRPLFNYGFQTLLDTVFVERMHKFLTAEEPDWVLCTHSLPQPALARWRKRRPFTMGIVVTDLYPQRMWLRGRPDWFFVPGEWSQQILFERYGRARDRTTVSGIPVDRLFAERQGRDLARGAMNLDTGRQTVLVTSGGIGGGPIADVVAELSGLPAPIQFVVVCGRNQEAQAAATVQAKKAKGPARVQVFGHVSTPEMAALMHASDLIVAKPGGITTFEALAAGLPFVVFDPFLIPGQEEKNAEFLVEQGIGLRAGGAVELAVMVQGLLESSERLASMSSHALRNAKPHAAATIVEAVEQLGPMS